MDDYTLAELVKWGETIENLAREEGLTFYPQEFEFCNYEDMLCYQAYNGMPSHYPHWSFGKAYEKLKTLYQYNISGLPYEMVINANPCLAYLLKENNLLLQILTMAHVYGHNDFFRNNRLFTTGTRAELAVEMFKNHARRIRDYGSDPSIGFEAVEKLLDAAHALRFQTRRVIGETRLSYEEHYQQLHRSHKEKRPAYPLLEEENKRPPEAKEEKRKVPPEPEEDLLWFITEYGDLEDWEKDILNIVREETAYFLPQIETKVMNEGWASFWHYRLLSRLDLAEELRWEFFKRHNQVVRPLPGSLNPYHVGFVIFTYLFEHHGKEKIFEAREVEKDQSFFRRYLNKELCNELTLIEYVKKSGEFIVKEIADEAGWQSIRDQLAKTAGLGAIPVVKVAEYRPLDRHLLLEHEHDGRDLEINYATETLRHCARLWKGKLTLKTMVNKEERIIRCDEKLNLSIL